MIFGMKDKIEQMEGLRRNDKVEELNKFDFEHSKCQIIKYII